jgi:2-dehydro-3-deoxyphosphooctonate aldolase (KDO 8-P synthase)
MKVRDQTVGPIRLTVIAGPCLAESRDLCLRVADNLASICAALDFQYVFKASFDKANRSSGAAPRGWGMDAGLSHLAAVAEQIGAPTTSDVHLPEQAGRVAEVVDLLQVPAFLCRQTDLLEACARTQKPVNVKKGQFLAPWDAKNIVDKLRDFGASGVMLTERGTTFGYNALVVDMSGLEVMRSFGVPVCFDATHSVQRPGSAGAFTGGNRDAIPALARAATAVGIDALFLEVHPDLALSDRESQWPLSRAEELLIQVKAIWEARRAGELTASRDAR